jgi:hypothetical protein
VSTFYKIEERVGGGGNYITWDGIFTTEAAAQARIQTHAANTSDCRAVLYQTGTNKGPVRVATV